MSGPHQPTLDVSAMLAAVEDTAAAAAPASKRRRTSAALLSMPASAIAQQLADQLKQREQQVAAQAAINSTESQRLEAAWITVHKREAAVTARESDLLKRSSKLQVRVEGTTSTVQQVWCVVGENGMSVQMC